VATQIRLKVNEWQGGDPQEQYRTMFAASAREVAKQLRFGLIDEGNN